MNWSQSVDQALCFGWIDGIRKSMDEESYSIRFTPRKNSSNWSEINIKKVEELTRAGLAKPAGMKTFSFRRKVNPGFTLTKMKRNLLIIRMKNCSGKMKKRGSFYETNSFVQKSGGAVDLQCCAENNQAIAA